jgi:4-amino-4-deoxy-L-arabinose transferase-like glycosyltransferase
MSSGRFLRRSSVAIVLALVIYPTVALVASRSKSSTFDEPIHLPPGYVSLTLGDHRMNPDHPPLVRRLAALPLLFLDVKWDREDFAWKSGRPWEFGKRFLFRWNDAETLLFWGRLPILALGVLLLLTLYLFARRHYGEPAALLTVFLGALHPDLLAHGAIVSTDLGITFFIFACVVAWSRVLEEVTPGRVAVAGALLGGACATKFSGVGLFAMLGLPALLAAFDREALRVRLPARLPWPRRDPGPHEAPPGRDLRTRRTKLVALALVFLAMAMVAVPVVWAAYGFHSPMAVDPEANARIFDWSTVTPAQPATRVLFTLLRRSGILPEAWTWGFLHFLAHTDGRPAFLFGRHSESGFWYYFPATFLLKTPLPLLILFALGLVTASRTAAPRRVETLVLLPLGLFFGLSMIQSINIGHRHLLPAYPFVLVIAGRVAGLASRTRRPSLFALVAVLTLWQAVTAARAFPHYLAYFNELGGGPEKGWRLLVDSNLDWGQELKGLRKWMGEHQVSEVKLAYFGTADVKYYGVRALRLPGYQPAPPGVSVREVRPGDVVVVSATLLQGLYLPPSARGLMDLLRPRPPVAVIGHSLFVYRADFTHELPDEKDEQP